MKMFARLDVGFKRAGFPIVCMDARAAADAVKSRRVKSDKADAYALAEMLRTGWYRAVYVKSEDSHRLKAMLGARDQLVRAKRALGNQVRGVLRPFGIRLPSRQGTKKFAEAAHQAVRRDNMLHASVTALLEALAAIEGQIARLDEQLKELARRSPVCWRLMSVPGVGPIVALAFIAAIEDINRFRRMRSVGTYLGLTTRLKLMKRRGPKRARVAVARRLAILLGRIWKDSTHFGAVPA